MYEAVDFIFKTNIEIYENILLVNNVNSYYERSCHIYRGKSNKINIEYSNKDAHLELVSAARKNNAKIVIISTNGQVSYEFIKDIVENSYSLFVIEDFENNFDFSDIINNNLNIIVLKSVCENGSIGNAVAMLTQEIIVQNFKAMTNYGDIDILSKLFTLFNIKILKNEDVDIARVTEQEEGEGLETKDTNNSLNESHEAIESSNIQDNTEIKKDETNRSKKPEVAEKQEVDYAKILIHDSRQSLIDEVTKFQFISIFSSNHTHVYILSKTPIYMNLVDNGIVLKKYNASNGEIIRLNIDMFNQNVKVLEIIHEISKTRRIFMDF